MEITQNNKQEVNLFTITDENSKFPKHELNLDTLLEKIIAPNNSEYEELLNEFINVLENSLKATETSLVKNIFRNSKSKMNFLKLIEKLEAKLRIVKIFEIFSILINFTRIEERLSCTYTNNSNTNTTQVLIFSDYEFEFNQGVSILLSHQYLHEILKLYETLIEKELAKNSKNKIFQNLLETIKLSYNGSFYKQNLNALIDRCVKVFLSLQNKNYNISDDFWTVNMEGLLKLKNFSLINEMILKFNFKSYNIDSMIRLIFPIYIKKNSLLELFEIFEKKFEILLMHLKNQIALKNSNGVRDHNEINICETVLNIFLEEITNSIELLNTNHLSIIYESIAHIIISTNNKIKLREILLEKFLIKICLIYRNQNVEIVENYLVISEKLLSKRIVGKIIAELCKINDCFLIFLILKMCRAGRIPIDLDEITIEGEVFKKVFNFVMDSTDLIELYGRSGREYLGGVELNNCGSKEESQKDLRDDLLNKSDSFCLTNSKIES